MTIIFLAASLSLDIICFRGTNNIVLSANQISLTSSSISAGVLFISSKAFTSSLISAGLMDSKCLALLLSIISLFVNSLTKFHFFFSSFRDLSALLALLKLLFSHRSELTKQ